MNVGRSLAPVQIATENREESHTWVFKEENQVAGRSGPVLTYLLSAHLKDLDVMNVPLHVEESAVRTFLEALEAIVLWKGRSARFEPSPDFLLTIDCFDSTGHVKVETSFRNLLHGSRARIVFETDFSFVKIFLDGLSGR